MVIIFMTSNHYIIVYGQVVPSTTDCSVGATTVRNKQHSTVVTRTKLGV